jgi:hypothetical protein
MGAACTRPSLRPHFEGDADQDPDAISAAGTMKFALENTYHALDCHAPLQAGHDSIPEAAVLKRIGRGVLDRPAPPKPKASAGPRVQGRAEA